MTSSHLPKGCEEWASAFEAELLGEPLPDDVRERVASHERGCAECSAERAAWRRLAEVQLSSPRAESEDAFVDKVLRAYGQRTPARGRVLSLRPWLAAGAVVVAAAAAAIVFVRSHHATPVSPPIALASVGFSDVSGDVRIDGAKATVASDVPLSAVVTTRDGRACFALDPGVRVCLGSETEASVADLVPAHRRIDVRRGHVVASLDPQPLGATFSVSTPQGSVTAIGTAFAVDVSNDGAVARVLHGVVVVRAGGVEERLAIHEQLRLGDSSSRTLSSPRDEQTDQALLDGVVPPAVSAPLVVAPSATESALAPPVASAPAPSPAELLRAARSLRGERKLSEAAQTYRKLQTSYPNTVEAHASYVSLGELELSGLSDPAAALRSFDTYLASPGNLTEEARYGRIRALRGLGRKDDERKAIEAFVADYPNSPETAELRALLAPK